jgi:hypothetical protein
LRTSTFFFAELDNDKTEFTVRWSPYNSSEQERATFAKGHARMKQGWSGTMEQLQAYQVTVT